MTLSFDRHTIPFRANVAGEVVRVTPMRLRWSGTEWLMECWVEERRRMVIFAVGAVVVEQPEEAILP